MDTQSWKDELNKLKLGRQALMIGVLLLACILVWITATLVTSQRTAQIEPELLEMARPLTPNLDIEAIERLENKTSFGEQELANFQIYKLLTDRGTREFRVIPIEADAQAFLERQTTDRQTPDETDEDPTATESGELAPVNGLVVPEPDSAETADDDDENETLEGN